MSHFSVLVITKRGDNLDKVMMPYHEFECTGEDNEYVVNVDETDSLREEYEGKTTRRLRSPDGELFHPYEDRFYRDPTPEEEQKLAVLGINGLCGDLYPSSRDWGDGRGHRTKVKFVPDGYEEIEVPVKELESFAEWASGWTGRPILDEEGNQVGGEDSRTKYGWITVDANGNVVEIINRTNPNSKWDWYQVGGRYSGRLITKDGRVVDEARFGDLDADAMKAAKVNERRKAVEEIFLRTTIDSDMWDTVLSFLKRANRDWQELPEPRPRGKEYQEWVAFNFGDKVAELSKADIWNYLDDVPEGVTIEQWIESAPWLSCWAVLRDGQWSEKGQMGWFGMSFGDKEDWPQAVAKMLESLSPDDYITVVDCHI